MAFGADKIIARGRKYALNWDLRKVMIFWTNSPMKNVLTWCMIEKLKHSFNDRE